MRGVIAFIGVVMVLATIPVWAMSWHVGYQFEVECKGHLKRAAEANSAELAVKELDVALAYLEREGKTSGSTSYIFTQVPKNDMGFWYSNLKSSRDELAELPKNSSPLERSNMLMKLRETIMDAGETGSYVTHPDGVHKHPSRWNWLIAQWVAFIVGAVGVLLVACTIYDATH